MTADGRELDADELARQFNAAMAAPEPDEPVAQGPPRVSRSAAEAPYGYKADGTPRHNRPGPGRPPKARVQQALPASEPKPGKSSTAPPKDYAPALAGLFEMMALIPGMLPTPEKGEKSLIPRAVAIKVKAQATVLRENAAGLAKGVGEIAAHNPAAASAVARLTEGDASWAVPAMFMLLPFAIQSASVWRSPAEGDMADVAARTDAAWDDVVKQVQAQMQAAQEQAAPEQAKSEGGDAR
jgi:hypothetical protein